MPAIRILREFFPNEIRKKTAFEKPNIQLIYLFSMAETVYSW